MMRDVPNSLICSFYLCRGNDFSIALLNDITKELCVLPLIILISLKKKIQIQKALFCNYMVVHCEVFCFKM